MRNEYNRDYLAHYGIIGMKWGVRRYQNADGTYTKAGLQRRARDEYEDKGKKEKNRVGTYDKDGKHLDNPRDADRWVKEDRERTKAVIDRSNDLTRNVSTGLNTYQNYQNRKAKENRKRLDLSQYSDQELRSAVNRELLERQYNDVFNAPETKVGAQKVADIVSMVGTGLAITSSGLGIALAIKQLKG